MSWSGARPMRISPTGMSEEMRAFYEAVYRLVERIPPGRVATYGQLAWMLHAPRLARQVGRRHAFGTAGRGLPCHRVVGGQGRLVPGWPEQRLLLEQEGIAFRENGCADLNACGGSQAKPGYKRITGRFPHGNRLFVD